MKDELQQFVFKGLLARHAVADLQTEGLLHKPSTNSAERDDLDLFAPVQQLIRNASIQMQRAYRILYVLENMVRDLIVSRFLEADGPTWFETKASAPMKTRVTQRRGAGGQEPMALGPEQG
jgi:hypothetical protein